MTRLVALSLVIFTFLTFISFEVECIGLRTRTETKRGNGVRKLKPDNPDKTDKVAKTDKTDKTNKTPLPKTTKLPKPTGLSTSVPSSVQTTAPTPFPTTASSSTPNPTAFPTPAPTSTPNPTPFPTADPTSFPTPVPTSAQTSNAGDAPPPTPPATLPPTLPPTPQVCSLYVDLYHEEGQSASDPNFGLYNAIKITNSQHASEFCAIPDGTTTVFSTSWGCTVAGEAWLYYEDYYGSQQNTGSTASISATADSVYGISIEKQQMADWGYYEQPPSPGDTPVFATFELFIDDVLVCTKQKGWGSTTDFTVNVANCAVQSC